jgi:hypothetical protein
VFVCVCVCVCVCVYICVCRKFCGDMGTSLVLFIDAIVGSL